MSEGDDCCSPFLLPGLVLFSHPIYIPPFARQKRQKRGNISAGRKGGDSHKWKDWCGRRCVSVCSPTAGRRVDGERRTSISGHTVEKEIETRVQARLCKSSFPLSFPLGREFPHVSVSLIGIRIPERDQEKSFRSPLSLTSLTVPEFEGRGRRESER